MQRIWTLLPILSVRDALRCALLMRAAPLSVPGSAFAVASSAAEVAAALHPSKSGPISPKRSRDDLVDENDPQSACALSFGQR